MIRVEHPGLLTTVQDLGRRGWQHLGIGVCGAMDAWSARAANALVGNDEAAALLEMTLQGPRLTLVEGGWLALTGADLSPELNGKALPLWRPVYAPAGSQLRFGRARNGCRAYLAFAGGLAVDPVLGSFSTDRRGGFGGWQGRALKAGDELPRRAGQLPLPPDRNTGWSPPWFIAWAEELSLDGHAVLRLVPGEDWPTLSDTARHALLQEAYRVSPLSDRMGLRLEGPLLELPGIGEKLSAGVAFGTLQLPPGGQPILLAADRQSTGGYPVLGTVASVDLARLGQLRPGEPVRFVEIERSEALALYRARERRWRRLAAGLRMRWPLGQN